MPKMLLLTTLLLILLSACTTLAALPLKAALIKPFDPSKKTEIQPWDPTETDLTKIFSWKQLMGLTDLPRKPQPEYEPDPFAPPPVNETELALRPKTTCTYQANYKMNTFYIFGDNWNVTKDELKGSCEKGRSRVLNHWSFREWSNENGTHFCAKVSYLFSCLMQATAWWLTCFFSSCIVQLAGRLGGGTGG
jgi:hypothetical protein